MWNLALAVAVRNARGTVHKWLVHSRARNKIVLADTTYYTRACQLKSNQSLPVANDFTVHQCEVRLRVGGWPRR